MNSNKQHPQNASSSQAAQGDEKDVIAAVLYALEELRANLELGILGSDGRATVIQGVVAILENIAHGASGGAVSISTDGLTKTLEALGKANATRIAEIEARANRIKTDFEALRKRQFVARTAGSKSIADIDRIIKNRLERYESAQAILNGTEQNGYVGLLARRDQFTEELKMLRQGVSKDEGSTIDSQKLACQKKLRFVTESIELQEAVCKELDADMETLRTYKNARQIVEVGIPPALLEEPK
ncbi:MAG: hypothetical protein KGI79_01100 [Patescibacteria group bacterium]|nr:hypothetical protein [Patescibacteria group bacterium]MDE2116454.1 hypothetical protein [Patescibacteria group bacterium]